MDSEMCDIIAGSHIATEEINDDGSVSPPERDDATILANVRRLKQINDETESQIRFLTNKSEEGKRKILELEKNRDKINTEIKKNELDIAEEIFLRSQCEDLLTSTEKQWDVISEQLEKTEAGLDSCNEMVRLHYRLRNPVEQQIAEFNGLVLQNYQLVERLNSVCEKTDERIREEYAAMEADTEHRLEGMSIARQAANTVLTRLRDHGHLTSKAKTWLMEQVGNSQSPVVVLAQLRKALSLLVDKNKVLKKRSCECDEYLENTACKTREQKELAAKQELLLETFKLEHNHWTEMESSMLADLKESQAAVDQADQEVGKLQIETASLQEKTEELISKNRALERTYSETLERIQALEAQTVEEIQIHNLTCQKLDRQIALIELERNILAGRMLELDKQLGDASLNHDQLRVKVEEVEKELSSIDAIKVQKSIDDLNLKIDTSVQRISKMDIPQKTAELERLTQNKKEFEAKTEKIGKEIEEMQECIRELQVYNREKQFTHTHLMRYKNIIDENDKLREIYKSECLELEAEMEEIQLAKEREKEEMLEKGRKDLKDREEKLAGGLKILAALALPTEEEKLSKKCLNELRTELVEQQRISVELSAKLTTKKERRLMRQKQEKLQRKQQKKFGQELFRLQKERQQIEIEKEELRLHKERERIQAEQDRLLQQELAQKQRERETQHKIAQKQCEEVEQQAQEERKKIQAEQDRLLQQELAQKQREWNILQEKQELVQKQREQEEANKAQKEREKIQAEQDRLLQQELAQKQWERGIQQEIAQKQREEEEKQSQEEREKIQAEQDGLLQQEMAQKEREWDILQEKQEIVQKQLEQEEKQAQKQREKIQAEQDRLLQQEMAQKQQEWEILQENQGIAQKQREQEEKQAKEQREKIQAEREIAHKQRQWDILKEKREIAQKQREQEKTKKAQKKQEKVQTEQNKFLQQEMAQKQRGREIQQEKQEIAHKLGEKQKEAKYAQREEKVQEQGQKPLVEIIEKPSKVQLQENRAVIQEVRETICEDEDMLRHEEDIALERKQRRAELAKTKKKDGRQAFKTNANKKAYENEDVPGWVAMLVDIKKENIPTDDSPIPASQYPYKPLSQVVKTQERKFFKSRRSEPVSFLKDANPKVPNTAYDFDDDDCQVTFVGPNRNAGKRKSRKSSAKK